LSNRDGFAGAKRARLDGKAAGNKKKQKKSEKKETGRDV
jgi:hypothetical protein